MKLDFNFKVGMSGFKFQVPGFKFQVPGFKFQVSGFKFQVSGFKSAERLRPGWHATWTLSFEL